MASDSPGRAVAAPAISRPKGGGAIRSIGESFDANAPTGTGSLRVPIPTPSGRSDFGPVLKLQYDSGAGNGPFGFGWQVPLPSISRRTDRGIPQYRDAEGSDAFVLSGAEDLVPALARGPNGVWTTVASDRQRGDDEYSVVRYRPRVEGTYARIERWTRHRDGDVHWRTISPENVVSLYGRDARSRIADPADARRIFTWLLCESIDDKGNAILYDYKAEDTQGVARSSVHEAHRVNEVGGQPNRYLKRVRYGNVAPLRPGDDLDAAADWHFEVVFDFGEHDITDPTPAETGTWLCRNDPFSVYRAGFEVRTYRLCRRVLVFHHFPDDPGVGRDCLVRSVDLGYQSELGVEAPQGGAIATVPSSVTQAGYTRRQSGGYVRRSYPPLHLAYTQPLLPLRSRDLTVRTIDASDGFTASPRDAMWIDIDGDGLPGLLTHEEDAWFYRTNLGNGRLGAREPVARPTQVGADARPQFADLAGDGQLDLVQLGVSPAGFTERTTQRTWGGFTPFASLPNVDWQDPGLQFVDLTGDGRADVLLDGDRAWSWHGSLGENGFTAPNLGPQVLDARARPRLVLAAATEALVLADMSGDGLSDLVRIRNGEISYWPNLGYGRFGTRVTMTGAPVFDAPDQFDPKRIRLADVDGSGVTDIVYLARDGVRVYFNRSGNSWSDPTVLDTVPAFDDPGSLDVVDLLGNGTACLVGTQPAPGEAVAVARYIDLAGGTKPYLLARIDNNLGAETRLTYAPSTTFALADRAAGRPWLTRLPFPVFVLERSEKIDHVSRSRYVTRYAYHHGYFDGTDREFRGFGLVEQWDTEERETALLSSTTPDPLADAASHVPPVLTRTWFHTGAWFEAKRISRGFEAEYYGTSDRLEDTVLPDGLEGDAVREACRALKGSLLRQEIYGLDGTPSSVHPYRTSERSYQIRPLQPSTAGRPGVFAVHPRESIEILYERAPDDPRVSHAFTLEMDDFGTMLRSATVAYGRRTTDSSLNAAVAAMQSRTLSTLTTRATTNPIDEADGYRAPKICEVATFELTGLAPDAGALLSFDAVVAATAAPRTLKPEESPTSGVEARLLACERTLFRRDDLAGPLPFKSLEPLALTFETCQLALTPGLVNAAFGDRATEELLAEAGYARMPGDDGWWIPSGRTFFSPDPAASPDAELASARAHFFVTRSVQDPFGHRASVDLDPYDLLPIATEDAVGNRVRATNNYRVLQPTLVADENDNRMAFAFDALGLLVGTAVMGKDGEAVGDTLAGFVADLDESIQLAQLEDPLTNPGAVLGSATSRMVYDLSAFARTRAIASPQPACAHTLTRETHVSAAAEGQPVRIQHTRTYSDGFGREVQRKQLAEPGPLAEGGEPVSLRWTTSGWIIHDNKGNVVRKYEPFFTASAAFTFGVTSGVAARSLFDPLGRQIGTLLPDHTWTKVVTTAWQEEAWDVHDTILQNDPRNDPHLGAYFARIAESEYLPGWHAVRISLDPSSSEHQAALKAAAHAATPTRRFVDALGRTIASVALNRRPDGDERLTTVQALDIQGRTLEVVDALDRLVERTTYDLAARIVRRDNMDSGTLRTLADVGEHPVARWNASGQRARFAYDALRRPIGLLVQDGDAPERLVERTVYGEPSGVSGNHRGRVFQQFDGAGVHTFVRYDFRGNPVEIARRLTRSAATPDWTTEVSLEDRSCTTKTAFDALGRTIQVTTPDGSVVRSTFNEANLLERLDGQLADGSTQVFVEATEYNARGQRTGIQYGNGLRTTLEYDPLTFRTARIATARASDALQDIRYTHDAAGNITRIRDDAQQSVFFRNRRVDPQAAYTYDALYRLIEASGREHLGQLTDGNIAGPAPCSTDDAPRSALFHPGDGNALGRYVQQYEYDAVGNMLRMVHRGTDPAHPGWTRTFEYAESSAVEPSKQGNRLSASRVGSDVENCTYDANGNARSMPHLASLGWDHADRLVEADLGGGGRARYAYDSGGSRVRKTILRPNGTRAAERLYLGSFEVYREFAGDGETVTLERESLHVHDGAREVVAIDTRTAGDDGSPARVMRTLLRNHLDSVCLEADAEGQILAYQEHYPFGSTSYRAVANGLGAIRRRFDFLGKERDDETGFTYHGARYYAPWLARWISCDPAGVATDANLYRYARDNPIRLADRDGADPDDTDDRSIFGAIVQAASEVGWENSVIGQVTDKWRAVSDVYEREGFTAAGSKVVKDTISASPIVRATVGPRTFVSGLMNGDSVKDAAIHGFDKYLQELPFASAAQGLSDIDTAMNSGDDDDVVYTSTKTGLRFVLEVVTYAFGAKAGGGKGPRGGQAKPGGPPVRPTVRGPAAADLAAKRAQYVDRMQRSSKLSQAKGDPSIRAEHAKQIKQEAAQIEQDLRAEGRHAEADAWKSNVDSIVESTQAVPNQAPAAKPAPQEKVEVVETENVGRSRKTDWTLRGKR